MTTAPPETFGHEPEWRDVGSCGMGACNCPDHYDEQVCARCVVVRYESSWSTCIDELGDEHRVYGSWLVARTPVPWPCTTAVVLGLTPRNGSRGASHAAQLAEAAGIPVRRFEAQR